MNSLQYQQLNCGRLARVSEGSFDTALELSGFDLRRRLTESGT
jgi:hypothetical protein